MPAFPNLHIPVATHEQEWKDAIALFVNVASAKGAFYHNLFLQGGRRMTWFAQPTHVPETPAIKRILATRREGEAGRGKVADGEGEGQGEDEGEVPVVLFCRQVRQGRGALMSSHHFAGRFGLAASCSSPYLLPPRLTLQPQLASLLHRMASRTSAAGSCAASASTRATRRSSSCCSSRTLTRRGSRGTSGSS